MSEHRSGHSIIEYVIELLTAPANTDTPEGIAEYNARLQTAYEIQSFLDEIPGGLLIYKADGNEDILYANSALVRIFGCQSFHEFKEHVRNTFKGVVHPDDLEAVEKAINNQVFERQFDLDYAEYRIVRKDGTVRWVEDFGHYVKSHDMGAIFYVFITDVTEKKTKQLSERAALIAQKKERDKKIKSLVEEYDRERKLINQEHLRKLEVIEGLSVDYETILYVDFDANTVFPYRQGNRVFRQFKGEQLTLDLDWYINDYVNNIVKQEDRERIGALLDPAYMRKKLSESKTYFANYLGGVDGIIQNLQIRIVNVGSSERVSQAVIGYRNRDKEVQYEREHLQALEEALKSAKQADVAKNAFLSNISHDLRTPLNAIFGYTQLARTKSADPQVMEYLEKINTSSKQMLELINKLLEISYIESKELTVAETECDLCNLLKGSYEYNLPTAKRKNIDYVLDHSGLQHRNVYADTTKLRQTLDYIIGNAVKYTEPGGRVVITVDETEQSASEFAMFRFTVDDNGIGIAPDALEHIFEPFMRGNNTTESGVIGLGLGLVIAKNAVETMGGHIDVQSELGKGSTFTVTLSLRINQAEAVDSSAVDFVQTLKNKRVLVVEDNEINLEIITDILEGYGLIVDSAENGEIAVQKVTAAPPDRYMFVVMDIQMPVMDGRDATRAIRALPDKHAEIPIIALSANAFESDKRLSIESGMNAHLTKPLDIDSFLETLSEIFSAHKV